MIVAKEIPYPRKTPLIADEGRRSKAVAKKLTRPSAKAQSLGERRNIMDLQLDRRVKAIEDQVDAFSFEFEGRICRTFPDAKVWLWDGTIEIIEVKFKTKRTNEALVRRLEAIRFAYGRTGTRYRYRFSDEFETWPRRSNIDLVYRYCDYPGAERFLPGVHKAVHETPGLRFQELAERTGVDLPSFLALVYDNHFEINLDAAICPEMTVLP